MIRTFSNNVKLVSVWKNKKDKYPVLKNQALPLVTIYFLGHTLEYTQAPVIHVHRDCYDLATKERIEKKEPFIESLTHDSYIIQIPHLHHNRRTEVEQLLQIFDQENNLINELKFDSLTHLSIDPTELAIELKSIVKQVHHNIYYSQSSELSEIEIQKQDFIKNKKSYLATLVS